MEPRRINCIVVDDEPVAREILESHLEKIGQVRVVASCKNAMEAFQAVQTHHVDLVFLDIQMPEISGLSFARSMNREMKIIFTTAYRDYAVDGFNLRAVDYLLKPISFERLLQGIRKYLDENVITEEKPLIPAAEEPVDSIFVRSDRKMVKINFSEIMYIESVGDYLKIHLPDRKTVLTRDTISNMEGRLPRHDFLRVHRSFLVSVRHIDSYTSDTIGIGKYEIPISRSYRDEVQKRLEGNERGTP